jgi:hypothetical protein
MNPEKASVLSIRPFRCLPHPKNGCGTRLAIPKPNATTHPVHVILVNDALICILSKQPKQ